MGNLCNILLSDDAEDTDTDPRRQRHRFSALDTEENGGGDDGDDNSDGEDEEGLAGGVGVGSATEPKRSPRPAAGAPKRERMNNKDKKTNANQWPPIAVTAPHGLCIGPRQTAATGGHSCDWVATTAAHELVEALRKWGAKQVQPFDATITRAEADLNRDEGADESFRPALREWMKRHKLFWVLDVHSFPQGGRSWGTAEANTAELVILNNYTGGVHEIHSQLATELKKQGFAVAIIAGSPDVNSITREAREYGASLASLLEFNEGLEPARLSALVQAIATALYQIAHGL